MAQALAAPGERRHGFASLGTYNLDFGRISALAVSKRGNLLICDNMKQKIVLVDPEINYLQHLPLQGNPWDVAINKENDAYVTVPNKLSVLAINPDRLTSREIVQDSQPICISAMSSTAKFRLGTANFKPWSNLTTTVCSKTLEIVNEHTKQFYQTEFFKLHCIECPAYTTDYLCNADENSIRIQKMYNDGRTVKDNFAIYNNGHTIWNNLEYYHQPITRVTFEPITPTFQGTLDVPSDICGDDNGHIYVCGQYSHNILRLTQEGKLVDIPLSYQHGIQYPVAMCFNQDCNKMYIANNWGRSILAFDVV